MVVGWEVIRANDGSAGKVPGADRPDGARDRGSPPAGRGAVAQRERSGRRRSSPPPPTLPIGRRAGRSSSSGRRDGTHVVTHATATRERRLAAYKSFRRHGPPANRGYPQLVVREGVQARVRASKLARELDGLGGASSSRGRHRVAQPLPQRYHGRGEPNDDDDPQ